MSSRYEDYKNATNVDSKDPAPAFPLLSAPTVTSDILDIMGVLNQRQRVNLYQVLEARRDNIDPPTAFWLHTSRCIQILTANNCEIARKLTAEHLNHIRLEGNSKGDYLAFWLGRKRVGRQILAANHYELAKKITPETLNSVRSNGESLAIRLARTIDGCKILAEYVLYHYAAGKKYHNVVKNAAHWTQNQKDMILSFLNQSYGLDIPLVLFQNYNLRKNSLKVTRITHICCSR